MLAVRIKKKLYLFKTADNDFIMIIIIFRHNPFGLKVRIYEEQQLGVGRGYCVTPQNLCASLFHP